MNGKRVIIVGWLPEGGLERLRQTFPEHIFVDARKPDELDQDLESAEIAYGLPPMPRLAEATRLRWIQLDAAGVPRALCPLARDRGIVVTNLAGLYGTTIAEHALALMVMLSRNLQITLRNQQAGVWDRTVMRNMCDLGGRTVAIVGIGNIGSAVARLARAYGMRTIGCRRTDKPSVHLDRLYPPGELNAMLTEADYVVVAAPLTNQTEGMLGAAEFKAMKPGCIYINVSRGPVAQEPALLAALQSGSIAGAGLDVYSTEPLPAGHPFWTMPQVVVSPHYSGEVINQSSRPLERFLRNLHAWKAGKPLEGKVDLEWGY